MLPHGESTKNTDKQVGPSTPLDGNNGLFVKIDIEI